MKVALFGGSFNPIHKGHTHIANEIINENIADEVWFIPCGNHPFGKDLASATDRLNMVNLTIKGNKLMKVITIELNENKSYTADTLKWFKKEFAHDFYIVIGADNIINLDKWHNFDYLKENAKFILITRPGYNKDILKDINVEHIIKILNPISATEIRNKIKNSLPITNLVNKEVIEYIENKELYK